MKDVVGFEGLYGVTEDGKVWSYRSKQFLKQYHDSKGYASVMLTKRNGVVEWFLVDQLAAQAYVEIPYNLLEVKHIDGNPKNNCMNNLQWVTRAENAAKGNLGRRNSNELMMKCIEDALLWFD